MSARDMALTPATLPVPDRIASEKTIQVRSVSFSYGNGNAVDNLTLDVARGEIFGFLGHNGAGKTTTIRLLNGLLQPSAGTLRVLGKDPLVDGPAVRRHTGVLTGSPSLDDRLSGDETLTIYGQMFGVPERDLKPRVREMIELFDMTDYAGHKIGTYSKGMKQRLALARALLHDPEILFLDEPTDGLDPVAARHVHQIVLQLATSGKYTIFLCTHNLVEAQHLCGRVAVLEHGKLLAMGTPTELADSLGWRAGLEIGVDATQTAVAASVLLGLKIEAQADATTGTLKIAGSTLALVPDLVAALVNQGIRIHRVVPQEPSLEDVYFALHGKQGDPQ